MAIAVPHLKPIVAPPRWAKDELWRKAQLVPSFDVPFASTKSLVDAISGQNLITFSRTSDATVTDSTGTLITVPSGTPRFDHNPITGESLGLLVEEQRANLLLRSEKFDNASWIKTQSSVSANMATSPSGTLTADSLVENTSPSIQHYATQNATISANTAYTATIYVKANTRASIRFGFLNSSLANGAYAHFNASTGAISSQTTAGTASSVAYSMTPVGSGWYRCHVTCIVDNSSTTGTFFVGLVDGSNSATYAGDGTSGIYLWGAQLEAGSFPTSYIPTEGTAVTRAADVASISGSNFSSWYRQDEGTLFADGNSFGFSASTFPSFAAVSDGTNNNRIQYGYLTSTLGGYFSRVANSGVVELYPSVPANPRRGAFAAAADNYAVSYNGASPTVDLSGAMPVGLNQMQIGNMLGAGSINSFFGHIRRLTYWPQRLGNEVLQRLTV